MPFEVLVVDDSPTIRRVAENALRDAGFDVRSAENGQATLGAVEKAAPDFLLLDFTMPDMTGFEVLDTLAKLHGSISFPVLLMATRTDAVPRRVVTNLGPVEVISKPFSPDDLVQRVKHLLDEQHAREANEESTDPEAGVSPPPLPTVATEDTEHTRRERPSKKRDAMEEDDTMAEPVGGDVMLAAMTADFVRVLASALGNLGLSDAEAVSATVANQVQDSLGGAVIREMVRRSIGTSELRGATPALYGDLAVVPLPEVLQLLKFQGQTGTFEVLLETGRFEAAFRDGRVVALRALSPRASTRLGAYFVVQGSIRDDELEYCVEEAGKAGLPLGQYLLNADIITPDQLFEAVAAQAQDLLFEILRARRGVFALRSGGHIVADDRIPGLSVDALLLESLRRVDEASVFKKEIPTTSTPLERAPNADEHGLTAEEIAVLRAFPSEGATTVESLALAVEMGDKDTHKLVYRLAMLGRVRRTDGADVVPPPDISEERSADFVAGLDAAFGSMPDAAPLMTAIEDVDSAEISAALAAGLDFSVDGSGQGEPNDSDDSASDDVEDRDDVDITVANAEPPTPSDPAELVDSAPVGAIPDVPDDASGDLQVDAEALIESEVDADAIIEAEAEEPAADAAADAAVDESSPEQAEARAHGEEQAAPEGGSTTEAESSAASEVEASAASSGENEATTEANENAEAEAAPPPTASEANRPDEHSLDISIEIVSAEGAIAEAKAEADREGDDAPPPSASAEITDPKSDAGEVPTEAATSGDTELEADAGAAEAADDTVVGAAMPPPSDAPEAIQASGEEPEIKSENDTMPPPTAPDVSSEGASEKASEG